MEKFIDLLKNGFFQVAIGLAIGFFGNVIWESWRTKVDELTYTVNSSDGILKGLKDFRSNARFTMDTREIDDFSLVEFKVFNTTGKNFENVPLSVLLQTDRTAILSHDYSDKEGMQDNIEFIQEDSVRNGVLYKYNLRIVNHNEETPLTTLRFVIGSPTIPKIKLSVAHPGVEISESKAETKLLKTTDLLTAVIAGILVTILVNLMFRLRKKQDRIDDKMDQLSDLVTMNKTFYQRIASELEEKKSK